MTLDNMAGITEGSYTGFCKSQLITCNRVKECNGVCPFEDALKHADKEMNEQIVIDHDRDWIIGCIKHDGFIKTDRFDKANQIILDALLADAVDVVHDIPEYCRWSQTYTNMVQSAMADTKSADAEQGFRGGKIPPKEMLDGTVLIPKHQWLEMERELAELKEKFESADAVHGEWVIRENGNKECSLCGHERQDGWDYFCGYCGARMKGGAE